MIVLRKSKTNWWYVRAVVCVSYRTKSKVLYICLNCTCLRRKHPDRGTCFFLVVVSCLLSQLCASYPSCALVTPADHIGILVVAASWLLINSLPRFRKLKDLQRGKIKDELFQTWTVFNPELEITQTRINRAKSWVLQFLVCSSTTALLWFKFHHKHVRCTTVRSGTNSLSCMFCTATEFQQLAIAANIVCMYAVLW